MSPTRVAREKPDAANSKREPASRVSPGLRIGKPDDRLEREADRIADQVMEGRAIGREWSVAGVSFGESLQRKCACGGVSNEGGCQECSGKTIMQRSPAGPGAPSLVPPIVQEVLRSPGQALDANTRTFFESRFGQDFGQVRLHSDAKAAESAAAVNALAYTVGKDVVLGPEQHNLQSAESKRLLAHELAHTVQQSRGGRPAAPDANDSLEYDADRAGAAAMNGSTALVTGCAAPGLARATPPIPTATAASAAAKRPGRIISEGRAPDGMVIDIEIGPAVKRVGLEQTLPPGTEVNLTGWQRAHQTGAGLGAESGGGIRYAPPEVNLKYQASGIERFIREFNQNKAPDAQLSLRTVTESHPGSLRLKSITYRLSAARGQARPKVLFETRIEIENATQNPRITLEKPEILGDWKEFLAPKKFAKPSAGGRGTPLAEPVTEGPRKVIPQAAPTRTTARTGAAKSPRQTPPPAKGLPGGEAGAPTRKASFSPSEIEGERPGAGATKSGATAAPGKLVEESPVVEGRVPSRGGSSLKGIGGALLGAVVEMAILVGLQLLFEWLHQRIERARLQDDLIKLRPGMMDALDALSEKILPLQHEGPTFANITVKSTWLRIATINDEGHSSEIEEYFGTTLERVEVSHKNIESSQESRNEPIPRMGGTNDVISTYSVPLDPSGTSKMAEAIAKVPDYRTIFGLTRDTEIRNWVFGHTSDILGTLPTAEKIRLLNRLLDGWVSGEDMEAIRKICESVQSRDESRQIRSAVEARAIELGFPQRTSLRVILAKMP